MNPNQDIIDIIRLNELEKMNDDNLLPEEEKAANRMIINRSRQEKMNKVRLKLPQEQVDRIKKQQKEFEDSLF